MLAAMPASEKGPTQPPRRAGLGIILIIALALAWGCNWPLMKIALTGVDPWTFRLLTSAVGGVVFLSALRLRGISLSVPRREWKALIVASFFNMVAFPTSSILALQYLPAGWTSLIAYTMPIWAVIMGGIVFRERVTARRIGALVLGLAGLAVLIGPQLGGGADIAKGVAIILLGAVLWAVGVVAQKFVTWSRPLSVVTAWQIFLSALPFVVISPWLPEFSRLAAMPPQALGAIVYTIFIGLLLGYYLFYRLLALVPVTVAGVASLAIPVVGVVSSALLLGEPIGVGEFTAMALVVGAIALVLFERPR